MYIQCTMFNAIYQKNVFFTIMTMFLLLSQLNDTRLPVTIRTVFVIISCKMLCCNLLCLKFYCFSRVDRCVNVNEIYC